MEHSFELSENVVFIIPLSKLFSSSPRMMAVKHYGGIRSILYLGTGRTIGFDIGSPFGAVHFQRGWTGPIDFVWLEDDEYISPAFRVVAPDFPPLLSVAGSWKTTCQKHRVASDTRHAGLVPTRSSLR